jgi:hypothetical protein
VNRLYTALDSEDLPPRGELDYFFEHFQGLAFVQTSCMLYGLQIRRHCTCNLLRRSFSSRSDKKAVMNWSANVLSTVTSDTEPTIIIEFDTAKYIFNVGENTNRAFIQNRPNWKKTRGLFLTSVGAQRSSGLSGEHLVLVLFPKNYIVCIKVF